MELQTQEQIIHHGQMGEEGVALKYDASIRTRLGGKRLPVDEK